MLLSAIAVAALAVGSAYKVPQAQQRWEPVPSPTFQSQGLCLEVGFTPDGKTGFAGGGNAASGAQVIKSTDSGLTWSTVWPSNGSKFQMNIFLATAVRDTKHAVVSGAFFQSFTEDGKDFFPALDMWHSPAQSASVLPDGRFAIVSGKEYGYGGNNIGVSEKGLKYTLIPIPDTAVNSSTFLARYAAFPSNSTWYVTAGMFPSARVTAANAIKLNKHIYINAEAMESTFVSQSDASGDEDPGDFSAAIVKSTDGGKTWTAVYQDTSSSIYPNGIHCASENHCIAVLEGASARIIVTRDGGKSWTETLRDDDPKASLFAVHMLSDTEAWAAGGHPATGSFEGRLFHSLDGGSTWTKEVHDNVYFVSLDMLNNDSGFASALTNNQPAGVQLWKYKAGNGTHRD